MTEKRIVKNQTSSIGIGNILALSLVATLSTPVSSCAFEEKDSFLNISKSKYTTDPINENLEVKRLIEYSKDQYHHFESKIEDTPIFSSVDFAFSELTQIFSDSQIDLDSEIQAALDNFAKISRNTVPSKNRFKK